jgi:signal transduction histidine kinase
VLASCVGAALFARGYPDLADVSFARLLAWQAPIYATWGLLLPVVDRIGADTPSWWRWMRRHALAGPAVIVGHAFFAAWWIARGYPGSAAGPREIGASWALERIPVDLLMYCFVAGALRARQLAWEHAQERTRTDRLERDLARAELDALRARLQPHFLFNALQSIAVLVRREPEGAARAIQDLAALLRASLRGTGATLVPLSDELALVERYVAIERVRFPDRLRVIVDCEPDTRDCRVPDLLLQPIVENAIRHGLVPRDGGTVRISARRVGPRLILEVRDDGMGLSPDADAGLGLGITRTRLRALYGADHGLRLLPTDQGTSVEIELPVRTEPTEPGS